MYRREIDGLRAIAIDDTWTGPAREGAPADIGIEWRIEGLDGLAKGNIGWCQDPYTTPSTITYATKGDSSFHSPTWDESWFPDAFIGPMAQLLIALETGEEFQRWFIGEWDARAVQQLDAAVETASSRESDGKIDTIANL